MMWFFSMFNFDSSAFMSLAARFPLRSNIDSDMANSDMTSRSVGVDDAFQSQETMSEQQLSDRVPIGISEARKVIDNEGIICNQFPEDGTTAIHQQKEMEIEIQVERTQHGGKNQTELQNYNTVQTRKMVI